MRQAGRANRRANTERGLRIVEKNIDMEGLGVDSSIIHGAGGLSGKEKI